MKHLFFYVFLILISIMTVLVVLSNAPKLVPKLITVETSYSLLSRENLEMEVSLYINNKEHPLTHKNAYDYIYLSNSDDSKRIEVSLKDIHLGHFETYLGEVFQKMTLILKIPYVFGNVEISEVNLSVFLENQHEYTFFLGDLFINSDLGEVDYLDWIGLNGIKSENSYLSRLGEIHIDFHALTMPIKHISIGTNDLVTFSQLHQKLILSISKHQTLLYNVPIIITFEDESVQTISNFPYFIDYQVIKESGPLLHVYALN